MTSVIPSGLLLPFVLHWGFSDEELPFLAMCCFLISFGYLSSGMTYLC